MVLLLNFLKLAQLWAPILACLFTIFLLSSYCSPEWGKVRVTPLFKDKGSPHDPTNYRPISLSIVLGKIMESVLATRIRNHYKDTNFLSHVQHGFRDTEGVDELLTVIRLFLGF